MKKMGRVLKRIVLWLIGASVCLAAGYGLLMFFITTAIPGIIGEAILILGVGYQSNTFDQWFLLGPAAIFTTAVGVWLWIKAMCLVVKLVKKIYMSISQK